MSKKLEKQEEKNERANLKVLKKRLAKIPSQTKNVITDAKLDDQEISVTLTLTDDALAGNDRQVRVIAKEAWEAGTKVVAKYGPYPDDKISASNPLIYIDDSAGNELARTSALGDFKWEG